MEVEFLYDAIHSVFHSEWRKDSNCYKTPESWFFGDDPKNGKSICEECSVRIQCLDDSMYYNDEGVRGEMSEQERISLSLHRKRYNVYFRTDLDFEGQMPELQELR